MGEVLRGEVGGDQAELRAMDTQQECFFVVLSGDLTAEFVECHSDQLVHFLGEAGRVINLLLKCMQHFTTKISPLGLQLSIINGLSR